jgi:hypothetical protein
MKAAWSVWLLGGPTAITAATACSVADLAMAQASLDAIMTQGVAETLASPAVSGGVGELRAIQ